MHDAVPSVGEGARPSAVVPTPDAGVSTATLARCHPGGPHGRMTDVNLPQAPLFGSVAEVGQRLAEVGYLASTAVATTVFLADRLGKPLLVEGPAGVGKTELAKAVARVGAARLVRLQCYEGIDESRALYEWNHAKQLLRITAGRDESWDEARSDVFGEE